MSSESPTTFRGGMVIVLATVLAGLIVVPLVNWALAQLRSVSKNVITMPRAA
jgi:hypothetical protein